MSVELIKVADVLDAAADYIDHVEREKTSTAQAERQSQIDKLASMYAEASGETMPDAIRHKLASSDKDVVALLQSMVEKNAGRVEKLGGAADKDDEKPALTVKEAADAASQRFLDWMIAP